MLVVSVVVFVRIIIVLEYIFCFSLRRAFLVIENAPFTIARSVVMDIVAYAAANLHLYVRSCVCCRISCVHVRITGKLYQLHSWYKYSTTSAPKRSQRSNTRASRSIKFRISTDHTKSCTHAYMHIIILHNMPKTHGWFRSLVFRVHCAVFGCIFSLSAFKHKTHQFSAVRWPCWVVVCCSLAE